MIEPRLIASGSGWRVYRVGRSSCIQLDRTDAEEPAEVWVQGPASDVGRTSLLGALVAGAYGAIDRATAIEAMKAEW